jgi:hypothetical protein
LTEEAREEVRRRFDKARSKGLVSGLLIEVVLWIQCMVR